MFESICAGSAPSPESVRPGAIIQHQRIAMPGINRSFAEDKWYLNQSKWESRGPLEGEAVRTRSRQTDKTEEELHKVN